MQQQTSIVKTYNSKIMSITPAIAPQHMAVVVIITSKVLLLLFEFDIICDSQQKPPLWHTKRNFFQCLCVVSIHKLVGGLKGVSQNLPTHPMCLCPLPGDDVNESPHRLSLDYYR